MKAIVDGLVTILMLIAGNPDKDVDLSREDKVPRYWAHGTRSGEEVVVTDVIMRGVFVLVQSWVFSVSL